MPSAGHFVQLIHFFVVAKTCSNRRYVKKRTLAFFYQCFFSIQRLPLSPIFRKMSYLRIFVLRVYLLMKIKRFAGERLGNLLQIVQLEESAIL